MHTYLYAYTVYRIPHTTYHMQYAICIDIRTHITSHLHLHLHLHFQCSTLHYTYHLPFIISIDITLHPKWAQIAKLLQPGGHRGRLGSTGAVRGSPLRLRPMARPWSLTTPALSDIMRMCRALAGNLLRPGKEWLGKEWDVDFWLFAWN